MVPTESLGEQLLDGLPDQLRRAVSEQALTVPVDVGDLPLLV
jgi:hypothetical protein